MTGHRIYTTSFASVYPHYVAKAEMTATKLGQTKPAKMTVKCIFILEKQAGDQQALPKQILIENISCK